MKVSITGANGFIGSHLVDKLLAKGDEVTCLIRKTSNLRWLEGKNVQFIEGDLHNEEALRNLVQDAEVIYHIAGVVKSKIREGYFSANRDATKKILDICTNHSRSLKKIVYASSQTAVGPSADFEHPVNELSPCKPITTYGESKKAAEEIVLAYKDKLPVTIVRPPAVYGPRDTEIFIFFQTIERGLNPMIGFDQKRLSLIHVSDLVDGFILAGESEKSSGQIYFISSEKYYSWEEVGKMTARLMGKKNPFQIRIPHAVVFSVAAIAQGVSLFQKDAATLNIEKARDITRRYWMCDVTKAKNELGYRQKISIEQGFEETIQWYRDIGWLKKR